MKVWIDLVLQLIGLITVISALTISIRLIFDKFIKAVFCEHKYTVKSRVKYGKKQILYLKCNKCGKEKRIKIYDDKFIIELEEEPKNE